MKVKSFFVLAKGLESDHQDSAQIVNLPKNFID
jgi:hypothetical protein